uniref:Acetyl-coenzyme A carboxylase carboxyl transferase subunit alpha n=1 Tax=Anthurium amnicola TaxID=1678845 RepID=A0A1D1YBF7_9ARAE
MGGGGGGQLAPVSEEPVITEEGSDHGGARRSRSFRHLIRQKLPLLFHRRPRDHDLRVLLSVLGCPLSPVSPRLLDGHTQPTLEVSSQAQYILRQFRATTGSAKMEGTARSAYASGKLRMAVAASSDGHRPTASAVAGGFCYEGCFVLWQMAPAMWLAELVVAGSKVEAGSDGAVAWRRTPWLRTHVARGGARPLRRFLQGLDPLLVAAAFSSGQFMGERHVGDEECFVLKLAADQQVLSARGDDTAEIIKHVMVGCFSQRRGLLVYLEDSQITRVQPLGSPPAYWETTTRSHVGDYRPVDGGLMVAHGGRTAVRLTRLGDGLKPCPQGTEMEETWAIDDVAFDVPGLSTDCFILPEDVRRESRAT